MPVSERYRPDPQYLSLGDGFADGVEAARFPELRLRYRNDRWAAPIGLDGLTDDEWLAHLGRFEPLPDNLPTPLAMRYHGHQFQQYNPALGDGRGFLFGQLRDDAGRLLDLGTKGSGTTPYSRGGDGRLTLKGGVREILATELLEALGVYTSKTLSVIETGEHLERHDEPSPTRACVLVRLSHSHIRFGSFQRHAAYDDAARITKLAEHVVEQYLPEARAGEDPVQALFRAAVDRSAVLCASWMAAGFVHGVLNTDNMNVTGESFDYGPYRFLPHYDPTFIAAYFDHTGLYAYGNQPSAVFWNLHRLGEALLTARPQADLQPALERFRAGFGEAFLARLVTRLGVKPRGEEADGTLADAAFRFLEQTGVSFDAFFHDWFGGADRFSFATTGPRGPKYAGPHFDGFRSALDGYEPALSRDGVYFERPDPVWMDITEIEALWARIAEDDDWSAFEAKLADVRARRAAYGVLPPG